MTTANYMLQCTAEQCHIAASAAHNSPTITRNDALAKHQNALTTSHNAQLPTPHAT